MHADRLVALINIIGDRVHQVFEVGAGGVTIDQCALAAFAAEQLIKRHVGKLRLDIPQRHIDSADGRHRNRAAPVVGAPIEELPDVLGVAGVLPDQVRNQVVLQIGRSHCLAALERRVAQPVDALVGHDLQRDVGLAGPADEHFCIDNFHGDTLR